MPHLLIAGATGSGKSVCLNALIACLLLSHTPETLRLILVDPKRVELVHFNDIPHLLGSVIVEVDRRRSPRSSGSRTRWSGAIGSLPRPARATWLPTTDGC